MIFSMDLREPGWLLRLAYPKFRVVRSAGIFWRNFRHIGEFPGEKRGVEFCRFFHGNFVKEARECIKRYMSQSIIQTIPIWLSSWESNSPRFSVRKWWGAMCMRRRCMISGLNKWKPVSLKNTMMRRNWIDNGKSMILLLLEVSKS
jgi:hypothetical protein